MDAKEQRRGDARSIDADAKTKIFVDNLSKEKNRKFYGDREREEQFRRIKRSRGRFTATVVEIRRASFGFPRHNCPPEGARALRKTGSKEPWLEMSRGSLFMNARGQWPTACHQTGNGGRSRPKLCSRNFWIRAPRRPPTGMPKIRPVHPRFQSSPREVWTRKSRTKYASARRTFSRRRIAHGALSDTRAFIVLQRKGLVFSAEDN